MILTKKNRKSAIFDVLEVLEGHTRGEKIFPYLFRIVSHPQKRIPALKKSIFGQSFEKIRKKNV